MMTCVMVIEYLKWYLAVNAYFFSMNTRTFVCSDDDLRYSTQALGL